MYKPGPEYSDPVEPPRHLSEPPSRTTEAVTGSTRSVPGSVPGNPALQALRRAHRILLLQGPVGPFLDRLAVCLKQGGKQVARVVFQGGDEADCRSLSPLRYTGTLQDWPRFLAGLVDEFAPDCVVLFGQTRCHHQSAISLFRQRGLSVIVLEEGYFRPGFITMELDGVNGYSSTLERFVWDASAASIEPQLCRWHFQKMAWHAARHYAHMWWHAGRYPNYQHHRATSPFFYVRYWLHSWLKKLWCYRSDMAQERRLFSGSTPYFLVALQHEGDSQLTHHSSFVGNADFVRLVLQSFAAHAPQEALIVFKQHPHCRGGQGLQPVVRKLAAALGLAHRVRYLLEGHTPDLAEHARGVVLVNSTVGLQTLERDTALMALGQALYCQPGLTHSGGLDTFWTQAQRPDPRRPDAFLAQLKNLTQMPCSVYDTRAHPLGWNV